MKLYQIIYKDIWRRKKRVLYAALGVVIGTMTVVGVLNIAQAGESKIYHQIEKYGANLTVIPAINNIDAKLGDLSLGTLSIGENYIPQTSLPKIREITDGQIKQALKLTDQGDIATIAPELYINTAVKGVSLIVVGVEPQQELAIKSWLEMADGQYLKADGQAVIGATTAQLLKVKTGDEIDINGNTFTVSGILKVTGGSEDYQLFTTLSSLQNVFNKQGLISTVDIRALCNACPVDTIASSINLNVPGVKAIAVKQIASSEMDLVQKVNRMMLSLAGITLLIGCFGVVNTMISSVHERTKDIGILRAVGASHRQIIGMFMFEAVVVGIIGGIAGYLAGTALAYAIGPLIFNDVKIQFLPWYLPLSIGFSVAIALLASIYPAFRATRIKIAEAFRAL